MHAGQVALDKAEHVVVVVIQGRIAIVVQRGDGLRQLIDSSRVDLRQGDADGVVTGLLDTGNVGGAGTNGNAGGVSVIVLHQIIDAGAGSLSVGSGSDVAAVSFNDGSPEIGGSGVFSQTIVAPQSSALGNVGSAVSSAVINDLLRELLASLLDVSPERSLLILGPVGEVGVVGASGHEQVEQGVHAGSVLFHAEDGLCIEGGGAGVRRVGQDVQREDHVIRGHGSAVGEEDVVAHGEVVIDSAVIILGNDQIGDTGVEVIGAVVGSGLAFDTVHDDVALTVGAEQGQLRHTGDVLVVSGISKERGELLREQRVADNQRVSLRRLFSSGLFGGRFFGSRFFGSGLLLSLCGLFRGRFFLLCAASHHGQNHHKGQQQGQQLGKVFHFLPS